MKTLQSEHIDQHFRNIELIAKGKGELTDYSYLDTCFWCGHKIRLFEWLFFNASHGFDGNCHKWCYGRKRKYINDRKENKTK